MTGRIITIRHGKPALSRSVLLSARDYHQWWAQYDETGLFPGQRPPAKLLEFGKDAETIFSSTMPRAQETAELIAAGHKVVHSDPLFLEAPLPRPPWWPWIKLSPRFWGVISRTHWEFGYLGDGREPDVESKRDTWKRVDQIIDRLAEQAADGDVILCAHGYLNWMTERRIRARFASNSDHAGRWRLIGHRGGNKYWSWRLYEPF